MEAQEESSVLDKIKNITEECPGIVPYYGMKKMIIEFYKNYFF